MAPVDFNCFPLEFHEFTKLIDSAAIPKNTSGQRLNQPRRIKLLKEFALTGGFAMVINQFFEEKIITNDAYDTFLTWAENDLHKTKKSEKTAYNIFNNLLRTITTPISYSDLASKSLLVSHAAAQEYLEILEKMFLIFEVPCFSIDEKAPRILKNKKFYFSDPFIFHAVRNRTLSLHQNNHLASFNFLNTKANWPALAENLTAQFLKRQCGKFGRLFYGRFGRNQEVDFVVYKNNEHQFFEVKYQTEVKPSDFAAFFSSFPKKKLTVISRDTFHESTYLKIVPLEIFLLSDLTFSK